MERDVLVARFQQALLKATTQVVTCRSQALPALQEAAALLWFTDPTRALLSSSEMEANTGRPLEDWLEEELRGEFSGLLRAGSYPTSTLSEMSFELGIHDDQEKVQAIILQAQNRCRLLPQGNLIYEGFRRYIIGHAIEVAGAASDILIPLSLALSDLFDPIPAHLIRNGLIYPCPVCQWPMKVNSTNVCCDSSWCTERAGKYTMRGRKLIRTANAEPVEGHRAGSSVMLKPAIWKFTLVPGLLELSLYRRLNDLGLTVELWPEFDKADVRVTIGEHTLDLDAKVWHSPNRLLTHLKSLPAAYPHWIVIPDYQRKSVNYLDIETPSHIRVFTESQCIKEISRRCGH
ncbi:restriction endonuclease-related protein [Pseudomonas frederiksbergensis]|uniref:REase associating with pPIWI RE domain-containing protein n=1 Tax=Pseudomonas frederiksbergensis TaxID=104087 RepID=A0A423KGA4_9PSED|nr:hypothetical protein [Pseudomonas frederiksbergensis]RON51842.1 hypothetical protein BK665_18445 [Pseudomonas frederiksbergensis]